MCFEVTLVAGWGKGNAPWLAAGRVDVFATMRGEQEVGVRQRRMFGVAIMVLGGWATAVPASQSGAEVALAKAVLGMLQEQSAAENAEYCGYIGYDIYGSLVASVAEAGGSDWCEPVWPEDLEVVASYHTHAGYDPNAWSEVPSASDMESDESEGIDGYVSTPGGRLWYIDTTDMVASQICGIGCLPQAPECVPAPEDDIRQAYAYRELVEKLGPN